MASAQIAGRDLRHFRLATRYGEIAANAAPRLERHRSSRDFGEILEGLKDRDRAPALLVLRASDQDRAAFQVEVIRLGVGNGAPISARGDDERHHGSPLGGEHGQELVDFGANQFFPGGEAPQTVGISSSKAYGYFRWLDPQPGHVRRQRDGGRNVR